MTAWSPDSEHGTRITRAVGRVTGWLGSFPAILIALGLIAVWAMSGPMMHFSDTWQLVINTFTTLVTFVMVFVIQNSQNRDSRAIQLKLDDLISAIRDADDHLVGIEEEPEKEIKKAQDEVHRRVEHAVQDAVDEDGADVGVVASPNGSRRTATAG